MNKTARRTCAVTAISAIMLGGTGLATTASAADSAPVPTTAVESREGGGVDFSVGANLNIDPVAIGNAIAGAINDKNDRGAMVRAALDAGFYNSGGKNTVVINQEVEFEKSFPVDKTAVGTFTKNGKTYSVFIFEGPGFIENKGDGGWINWGFMGNYERDGQRVTFN